MKNTNLLYVGLMLALTLTGCNQPDKGTSIAPTGMTVKELKAQSAKMEAERDIAEIIATGTPELEVETAVEIAARQKAAEEAAAKAEEEKDRWDYSTDTDKMTSKITRYANITAENAFNFSFPYEGDSYGRLMIRQRVSDGLSVIFSISKGQFICIQSCRINVRFDDKPAMKFTGTQPADYSSTSVFLSPESKFLAELKKSKKMLIETTYYSAGSRVSEFRTDGFKWESKTGR